MPCSSARFWLKIAAAVLALLGLDLDFALSVAEAAGNAYSVDTADVSEPGSCKVESWLSMAANTDFVQAINPACVADLFRPTEFSAQLSRTRAGGDWATSIAPKAKVALVPTAIGKFGFAAEFGGVVDAASGANTAIFAYVPATLRLSEVVRINLNGGWLWDRLSDKHFYTYGAAIDWKLTEVWSWTGEVFGQGASGVEDPQIIKPRLQTGVRYRPIESFSLDLIYGRNITGENSHWFTAGMTVRFAPDKND